MNIGMLGKERVKRGSLASKLACADVAKHIAQGVRRYFREKHNFEKVREKVAADYGVSDRQAGTWFRSGPPMPRLAQMIAREGMAFVHAVIHPIAHLKDINDARLNARQAALDAQLAAEQADLAADLSSGGAGRGSLAGRRVSVIGALKARLRREAA
ncbi:hypothetical protein [Azospirillum argentinense]|uniref:hypothetical protein n=1 Tax=Azospirillum argentinense TaxID=2970906 RepID=UPI0032E044FF